MLCLKDINFDNIQDKYINWDAYFEYMNTRYNFHLNKWEIFVQRYGQPVKLNDMVSRIIDKTIGLRIPIYPVKN